MHNIIEFFTESSDSITILDIIYTLAPIVIVVIDISFRIIKPDFGGKLPGN